MIPPHAFQALATWVLHPLAGHVGSVVAQNAVLHAHVVTGLVPAKFYYMLATHLTNSIIHLKWHSIVTNIMGSMSLTQETIFKMLGVWVAKSLFQQGFCILLRHGVCFVTTQDGTVVEDSPVRNLMVNAVNAVTAADITAILLDPLFK